MNIISAIPNILDIVQPNESMIQPPDETPIYMYKSLIWIVTIVVILVLILIGAIVFYIVNRSKKSIIPDIEEPQMLYGPPPFARDEEIREINEKNKKEEKIELLKEQHEKILELQHQIEDRRKQEQNSKAVPRLYGPPRPKKMDDEIDKWIIKNEEGIYGWLF